MPLRKIHLQSLRAHLFFAISMMVATLPAADAALPNILFIAVDDLRPALGCYGDQHASTPHIDSLAKRGVKFDQAHCQVAVCNPSRASLMTGLRPDQLGIWTLPIHFREAKPDAVTLPQWFRRFGYTAVSHGKIFHNPTPDPQSWSEPIRALPATERGYAEGWRAKIQTVQQSLPARDWRKNNLRGPITSAPVIDDHLLVDGARTDLAIEDIQRLGQSDAPFFLAMGFIRPHLPWIAPKKYWDLFDPQTLPVQIDGQVIPHTPPYAMSSSYELTHYVDQIDFPTPWDKRRVSEATARQLMHGYYASVSYIDAQIGRILKALEEQNLTENTIVILWSDHGWKLGEYNGWGKMTNYEIDTRVPLIISAPGIKNQGQPVVSPVELLDLFPTLCELAGIDIPDFVQGKSLLPMLNNPTADADAQAVSQYYRKLNSDEVMGYALRTATHRFVEWRDFTSGTVKARELYDHRDNHLESQNIITDADPALVAALTTQLLQTHPRHGLRMVPPVHSNPAPDRHPVAIRFANQTQSDLLIYPITPQGRRGKARICKTDATVSIGARIGGVYVVESRDGTVHEIHSPSFPEKTISITTVDSSR